MEVNNIGMEQSKIIDATETYQLSLPQCTTFHSVLTFVEVVALKFYEKKSQ